MASGAVIAVWVAHALAWAAGIGLSVVPVYRGATTRATSPGEPPAETIMHSATLIEVNGAHAILLLLIPVLLTGMAVLAMHFAGQRAILRRCLLWLPAIDLLGFCVVSMLSIGAIYLPAVVALLCGAAMDAVGGGRTRAGQVR